MPRSPRWLLEQGRDAEALAVVRLLHGTAPGEEAAADAEFAEMQATIKAEQRVRSRSLSDLWATRGMLRRTLVAVGVQVFGQFSGINVINYFGPSMYRALGLSAGQSLLVQGIYGAVGPITNFLYVFCSRRCRGPGSMLITVFARPASSRSSWTLSGGRSPSCSARVASWSRTPC